MHVTHIIQCYIGDEMTTLINGGPCTFTKEADLKLLPMKVYFDQESLATVLSYHEMKNLPGIRITIDTAVEDSINVYIEEKEEVFKFMPCGASLYFLDVENMSNHRYKHNLTDNTEAVTNYSFVQSVASNKESLTQNEVDGADKARYH